MTDPDNPFPELTYRQRQIALLVAEGYKYTAVAEQLGISPSTVGFTISRLARRLMRHEQHLSDHQAIIVWVRKRQWEIQRAVDGQTAEGAA